MFCNALRYAVKKKREGEKDNQEHEGKLEEQEEDEFGEKKSKDLEKSKRRLGSAIRMC
jgi:hypothetical protein